MQRAKIIGFTFAFLCLAFSLFGCSSKGLTAVLNRGSQLVTATLSDPKTFNWALNQEFPNIFLVTYQGLTTENGLTGEIEPALAKSWEISEDKQRIVFTLREGLQWSDGQPLTTDDVVFTYEEVIFNKQIPTDAKDSLKIGTEGKFPQVRKLDEQHVEFILPEPFAPFLRTTAGPPDGAVILPKHALQKAVNTKNLDGKPLFLSTWGVDAKPAEIVVNGPYLLESYTTSERVVFRRNPYYWRKDHQGNSLPYIERVVWQIVQNMDTQLLQFRSKDLDMMDGWGKMRPEDFPLLKREEKRGNFKIYTGGPRPGTNFISFNLNKGRRANGRPLIDPIKSRWFNTVEFRQAIAYAIDRQTMVNNILRGLGELQNSPITVQSPYYITPGEGLKVYQYNPQRAKELLLGAGFQYNDQGQLLDADGNRVRFTLITNAENNTRVSMGAHIKQNLSKIGIQVDFEPIAFNTLVDKLGNSLDWECYLLGFTGGVEPHNGANVWLPDGGLHSFNQAPQAGQPAIEGREVAPWEAEIGRLYIKAAQELDETKRKAIYAETQRLTQEYLPMIYLVNPLAMSAVRDRVQGIKFSALGGALWNLDELKLTEK